MVENIVIIALAVYALSATMWPDHIFESVGQWGEENLPEKLRKPLMGCPICMTPWWGTITYLVADVCGIPSFQDARWFMIIATVIPAMGVNALIVKITGALDDIADTVSQVDGKTVIETIAKVIDRYFIENKKD